MSLKQFNTRSSVAKGIHWGALVVFLMAVVSAQQALARPEASYLNISEAFNIQMNLDGFPWLENDSSIRDWERLVSLHVGNYWKGRNYEGMNVTGVVTKLISQTSSPPSPLGLVYDQRIKYVLDEGTENPIETWRGGEDELFLRPFQTDSQTFTDSLRRAFNISHHVVFRGIFIIPLDEAPEAPSQQSEPPDFRTGAVVGIVVGSLVGCTLLAIFIIWYRTHDFESSRVDAREQTKPQDLEEPYSQPREVPIGGSDLEEQTQEATTATKDSLDDTPTSGSSGHRGGTDNEVARGDDGDRSESRSTASLAPAHSNDNIDDGKARSPRYNQDLYFQ